MNLNQLQDLYEEMAGLETLLAEHERRGRLLSEELRALAEDVIPEAMERLGIEEFVTAAGHTLTVEKTLRASASKERAAGVFGWLRDNGHRAIIKRKVSVTLATDERGDALLNLLKEHDFDYSDVPEVNAQTLSKFVRLRMADGHDLPQDLLGIYLQRRAKLKVSKR